MNRLTEYSLAVIFVLTLLNSPMVCGQNQSAQHKQELSDNDIAAAIKADIAGASRIAGGVINVDVNTVLVTLSGTATSLLDKQMSAKIAKRNRGVYPPCRSCQ